MPFIYPPVTLAAWRPWEYIPTSVAATKQNSPDKEYFTMSFGIVPKTVLPSSKFQIWTPINNCYLTVPWSGMTVGNDALPLATTGGLLGAIGALGVADIILSERGTVTYSLTSSDGYGPIVGYCLGNVFAERVFISVTAMKDDLLGGSIVTDIRQDVLQRYRVSRFLFHHGTIETYYKGQNVNEEYLSLGIDKLQESVLGKTPSITIYKKNGNSFSTKIQGFLKNGDAIVAPFSSTENSPESGDFYVLSEPYFLDDPYMMAGIWRGSENELSENPSSGFDLPITTNQSLFTKFNVIGGYALMKQSSTFVGPVNTNNQGESLTPVAGGVGQPMVDGSDTVWAWWLKNKDDASSDCYYGGKEDRPSTSYELDESAAQDDSFVGPPSPGSSTPVNSSNYVRVSKVRPTCSKNDVLYGVTSKQSDHIRIEIREGGSSYRNNFHFPLLQYEYVKQNNSYFKILAQIDAATIDVSYTSVDGKNKLDIDGELSIINQYAWKIIEHYSGSSVNEYGEGTISSLSVLGDKTSVVLEFDFSTMSAGTVGGPYGNRSKEYLSPNSFHKRFSTVYSQNSKVKDMYEKGVGWVLSVEYGTATYPVNKLLKVEQGDVEGVGKIKFHLELDGKYEGISAGSYAELFFGTPHQKDGPNNGGATIGAGSSIETFGGNICLEGNFTSPYIVAPLPSYVVLGVCDSVNWGNGLVNGFGRYVPMFFITTPEGFLALSSYYNNVPFYEGILFSDYSSKKVCLRTGALGFYEFPQKEEIAMGQFAGKDTSSGASISLNGNYDRINAINIKIGDSKDVEDGFVTFALGDKSGYYGTEVSGNGKLQLRAIDSSSLEVNASDVKNGTSIVSPVYMYKKGFNSLTDKKFIPIGASTIQSTLYVKGNMGDGNAEVVNCDVFYVHESQTIESFGGMDMFVIGDGEKIVVFNKRITYDLMIDNKLNNSADNNTEWQFTSSNIMITGAHGSLWGTPIRKRTPDNTGIYSIPLMVANSSEYLCASYSDINKKLYIFAQCYNDNAIPFIGCFSISVYNLFQMSGDKPKDVVFGKPRESSATDVVIKPENYKDVDMPFWFRPVRIGKDVADPSKTYTATGNIPQTSLDIEKLEGDLFSRVYGISDTKAKVEGDNWGIVSSRVTQEGYVILFINTPEGLTFIFSNDGGRMWRKSKIILSREGANGFMIDDRKVYYLVQGIGVYEKDISSTTLSQIIDLTITAETEGNNDKNIEQLQQRIDNVSTISIGTGSVNPQKFSGHVTIEGIRKVFFYDQNGYLSCTQSNKDKYWSISNNF